MTDEIIIQLNALCQWGEVKCENDKLFWYYEDNTNNDENQDHMWTAYCEDAEIIRNAGYETSGSWGDNDSCGFDITVK